MSQFGEKLRSCRIAFGFTQDELASMFGTTKQVLSHYETGKRTPKLDVAARYAQILHVPVEYLANDHIFFKMWEHESLLEDYWNANPSDRIILVARRGIDPRVAEDYKTISTIEKFVLKDSGGFTPQEIDIVHCYRVASSDDKAIVDAALRKYINAPALSLIAARDGGVSSAPSSAVNRLGVELEEDDTDL